MNASVRYDEAILKSAIYSYINRVYLKQMLWPTLGAANLVILAFYSPSAWLQSFTILTLLMVPAMVVLGYWARIKHSLKILSHLDDGRVEFSLTDDGVAAVSGAGHSHIKWKMFTEL